VNFQGYRRPDGKVGTRNYVLLIRGIGCSQDVDRAVAAGLNATDDFLKAIWKNNRYPPVRRGSIRNSSPSRRIVSIPFRNSIDRPLTINRMCGRSESLPGLNK